MKNIVNHSNGGYSLFLGEGFFNTLNDISSIASTVGQVKSSLSGGSGGAVTQTTNQTSSVSPSTNYEIEKLKLQLLANENARNIPTKSNNTLMYVSMGVGGLILIAVLILALK
tara:strand:- start:233 stop:571 length:339 start_codon:yes stop_codon:yes gene_type:complete